MGKLSEVVQYLKKEMERAQKEVQQYGAALAALESNASNGSTHRHTLSAATRRKISLAQRARWAKAKGPTPKPTRTMSATARKKIAAAQRARWAKMKSQKKAA